MRSVLDAGEGSLWIFGVSKLGNVLSQMVTGVCLVCFWFNVGRTWSVYNYTCMFCRMNVFSGFAVVLNSLDPHKWAGWLTFTGSYHMIRIIGTHITPENPHFLLSSDVDSVITFRLNLLMKTFYAIFPTLTFLFFVEGEQKLLGPLMRLLERPSWSELLFNVSIVSRVYSQVHPSSFTGL